MTQSDREDAYLERRIAVCRERMQAAYACGDLNAANVERMGMEHLLVQRSPAQIARMEREQGLSHG